MSRIALISCTSLKKDYVCQAKELYSESATFRLEYELASILSDEIYILSAMHGLIAKDTVLAPYNYTLMHQSKYVKRQWSERLLNQLKEIHVAEKENRLRLEEALISLLNKTDDFCPANDWLGNFSPVDKIRQSGLWLTQGISANPLLLEEFPVIKDSVRFTGGPYTISINPHIKSGVSMKKLVKPSNTNMPIAEIRLCIATLLQQKKSEGEITYTLRAGDLQKTLGIINATPSVCDAMTKKINYQYEIIFAPPKGRSTRLTVKYYL